MKKFLTLLLALVMALSLIPTMAMAATSGPESMTTNGNYNDTTWSEGGTGTITTKDGLTLSKTAESVGENTYRINLTVTTTQTTTTVTTSSDAATVLVIDCSGSMAWCTQNHKHTEDCYSRVECTPENNPSHWWTTFWGKMHDWDISCRYDRNSGKYYMVSNTCGESQHTHDSATGGQWCDGTGESRMTSATNAAKAFLDNYRDTTAARWVAVVSFASKEASSDWFNVSTNDGYNNAIAAINGLKADGGTNLDAGLRKANELMSLNAVSAVDKANKNVIALTDGAPTKSANYGNGRYGSSQINDETESTATTLKGTVNALYTICFAASGETCYQEGPTVDNFLANSIASSPDKAYTTDDAFGLNLAFTSITTTITSGLTGDRSWTVTDPMAKNISVTGSLPSGFVLTDSANSVYTWTLGEPKVEEGTTAGEKIYTYSTSYTVKIDNTADDIEAGKFYPTNGITTLHYGDNNADFPVPGVKATPVTHTVTYKVDGETYGTVETYMRGEAVTVAEAPTKEGYTFSGWTTDDVTINDGKFKMPNEDVTLNGTFTLNTGVITIEKVFARNSRLDGDDIKSVKVNVLDEDNKVVDTVTLKENQWTANTKALPYGIYTVKEVDASVAGYNLTITYNYGEDAKAVDLKGPAAEVTITNSYAKQIIPRPTPTTPVEKISPKTADAGIAIYGVLSVMSLMGTGLVIGKKKEF